MLLFRLAITPLEGTAALEKALNTWHSKQVMGSANMAVANTAHTSNVSVTDADIKAWRASNVDCSEWMTDDNIECVISCERNNKIESLVKKKWRDVLIALRRTSYTI